MTRKNFDFYSNNDEHLTADAENENAAPLLSIWEFKDGSTIYTYNFNLN